jgi:hypothetical protein
MENQRDEKLWKLAEQRAGFKRHVLTYFAVNAFLWAIWLFNRDQYENNSIPWPAWASLGWGFGLLMNYIRVYHFHSENEVEKEYKKLIEKENK